MLREAAGKWLEARYDGIMDYMRASGSPDAAVFVALSAVVLLGFLTGNAIYGFIFGVTGVGLYSGLSVVRLWMAVGEREQSFDDTVQGHLRMREERKL
jgi:hypothetical protein